MSNDEKIQVGDKEAALIELRDDFYKETKLNACDNIHEYSDWLEDRFLTRTCCHIFERKHIDLTTYYQCIKCSERHY